ncbi:MAG TPA: aldolase/citrate lyase family protein, partial [Gammaproteobacteria bacterium]|nr:aldolase/citrate lyase family protein [Gammaproteobacteria bacterium]
MTILRSLLFVPGNKSSMLTKALGLKPDAYVPDMEDSVPPNEKGNAREMIRGFLPQLAATGVPVIPRVNALETDWIEADLGAVVGPHVIEGTTRTSMSASARGIRSCGVAPCT